MQDGVYDKAKWHSGSPSFPRNLPAENGGRHIGMFLAWAIHNDLVDAMHHEDDADAIARVKAREMTGREFLFQCCDGVLMQDDLSDEGNAFATFFYNRHNPDSYDHLYQHTLGGALGSIYQVRDDGKNFDRLARRIDQTFRVWRKKRENQSAAL